MKKLKDCEDCQMRLKYILFGFSIIGFASVTKEIYKKLKNIKNERN